MSEKHAKPFARNGASVLHKDFYVNDAAVREAINDAEAGAIAIVACGAKVLKGVHLARAAAAVVLVMAEQGVLGNGSSLPRDGVATAQQHTGKRESAAGVARRFPTRGPKTSDVQAAGKVENLSPRRPGRSTKVLGGTGDVLNKHRQLPASYPSRSKRSWLWLEEVSKVLSIDEGNLRRRCAKIWAAKRLARKQINPAGQQAWQICSELVADLRAKQAAKMKTKGGDR